MRGIRGEARRTDWVSIRKEPFRLCALRRRRPGLSSDVRSSPPPTPHQRPDPLEGVRAGAVQARLDSPRRGVLDPQCRCSSEESSVPGTCPSTGGPPPLRHLWLPCYGRAAAHGLEGARDRSAPALVAGCSSVPGSVPRARPGRRTPDPLWLRHLWVQSPCPKGSEGRRDGVASLPGRDHGLTGVP